MIQLENNIIFEKNKTILKCSKNFIPEQVFDCGQCFRFDKKDNNTYAGVVKGKYIEVSRQNEDIILDGCSESDFRSVFRDFFDLDFDYGKVYASFDFDNVLCDAANYSSGIRILHQDEWETLCSFIISQNNNIPRIKGIIRNLCCEYGEPIFTDTDGNTHYSFPAPQVIASAGIAGMAKLKTGFRAPYIYDAASKVASGEIDLSVPYTLSYTDAAKYLQKIKGVGLKVASCVLLFAYRKYDAFPVDVWVKKILEKYYDGKVGAEYFGEYAGIAQQLLFYYERCKNNVFLN